MDFSKVKSLTIPEGNVVKIMSGDVVLWTKSSDVPIQEGRLLYLQNGEGSPNPSLPPGFPPGMTLPAPKVRNWSIDTGITWRDVFLNSSSLGLEHPGLETEITYLYSNVPPEAGIFAGCNPQFNQEAGGGDRDAGGVWRLFGLRGRDFCFYCPSDGDRITLSLTMEANRIYTETAKYGYLGTDKLTSYLKVTYTDDSGTEQIKEGTLTPRYTWNEAALGHNLYLWADDSRSRGDTAPRSGVRIYGFTVYYLENGVRHTKVYEGVPWMDSNGVACIKDLVSGQLQYNCSSDPKPFLYSA